MNYNLATTFLWLLLSLTNKIAFFTKVRDWLVRVMYYSKITFVGYYILNLLSVLSSVCFYLIQDELFIEIFTKWSFLSKIEKFECREVLYGKLVLKIIAIIMATTAHLSMQFLNTPQEKLIRKNSFIV